MLRWAVARARSVAASGELALDFVRDAAVSKHEAQNKTSNEPMANEVMRRMGYMEIITAQDGMQSRSCRARKGRKLSAPGAREAKQFTALAVRTSGGVSESIGSCAMVVARALRPERHRGRLFGNGNRRQHTDNVEQTLLLVRLGHAHDGTEGMRGGIVVRLAGASGHDNRDALEALIGFHDEAEVVAGHVADFDFGNEQIGSALAEEFDGFRTGLNGFDNVTFADEHGANGVARAGIGFDDEDQGHWFFEVAGYVTGCRSLRRFLSIDAKVGALAFVEANADAKAAFGHFENAGDYSGAFVLNSTGGAGVRERDYEIHATAVLGQAGSEEQTIARGVNGGADFGFLKAA